MTAPTSPPQLPRIAGGFRLVRELGRGGMGIVYEAEELDSGRSVALKVLAADLSVAGEAFERFRREARLAAAISDARCVFVYGAHEVEASPAIAMELVGGETLQDKIARGERIPVDAAVRWTIDVIDGLEAAHRSGVIHRDVKPSNCFVTPDGRVKVGDFGLSRSLERDIELTQSGQFLGSPLYASPEQIRGRAVDARSDQYSCAATLYALLTGRPPFEGSNLGEVLARILSEAPPRPRSIQPETPRELERVVLRGMNRDPDGRYRDLEAFREALLPFSSREAAVGSIPRRLGAFVVDAGLVMFASSMIATAVQGHRDFVTTDQERPWLAIPIWIQIALQSLPVAYFCLFEGWFGAALGKWLFGLRIAPVGRGPALFLRVLARTVLFEAPALLFAFLGLALAPDQMVFIVVSAVGTLATLVFRLSTMRRRNGWRGPYELWSGTRVIRAQFPFQRLRRTAPPPEASADRAHHLPEQIGEYRVLGLVGNTASGPLVHARDERLERSVWIQLRERALPAGERRRSLSRPSRLRWLEALRSGATPGDVFESPGGCDLAHLVADGKPLPWPLIERSLAALCEELARCEEDGDGPQHYALGQVWLDRNWNARLLDEPVSAEGGSDLSAVELVGAAARTMLRSGTQHGPTDLPIHAEPLVAALEGRSERPHDLAAFRAALADCQSKPAMVERRTRAAQLAVNGLVPALLTVFAGIMFALIAQVVPHVIDVKELMLELKTGQMATAAPVAAPIPLTPEGTADRQIALVYELTHGFGSALASGLAGEEARLFTEARAAFPTPGLAEFEAARARILSERQGEDTPAAADATEPSAASSDHLRRRAARAFGDRMARTKDDPGGLAMGFAAAGALMWLISAALSALILPGGITPRLFGLALRRRDGRRGGRLTGLARSLVIGIGPVIGYGAAFALATGGSATWAWIAFAAMLALHLAGLVATLAHPASGPIDRLLGTRLVPR